MRSMACRKCSIAKPHVQTTNIHAYKKHVNRTDTQHTWLHINGHNFWIQ